MATRRERLEAELVATDKASQTVDKVGGKLDELDGRTADATLEATDHASDDIDRVDSGLDGVDGRTADATLEATDHASDDIDRVDSGLDGVDGRTARATVDVTAGSGLSDVLGDIEGVPGQLQSGMSVLSGAAGAGGAIGLAAAATIGLVGQAAEWGAQVDRVARLTGDSTENVSRFLTVWQNAGFEEGDLLDIVAQMVGVLNQSPEIAEQLGLKLDGSRTPLQLLQDAVTALNSDQLSANDKILLGSQLFGEEGVRQINGLVSAVGGDLQGAIDGVAESRILSQEDVDRALALKADIAEVKANFQAIVTDIGSRLLPVLQNVLDKVNEIEAATGVDLLEAVVTPPGQTDPGSVHDIAEQMAIDAVMVTQALEGEVEMWTQIAKVQADVAASTDDVAGKTGELELATTDANAAFDEQEAALETLADQLEENIEALTDYIDAQAASYDANIRHREATEDTADAIANYADVSADAEASDEDRRDAGQRVVSTILDEANAYVEMTRKAAESRGETLSNQRAIENWNSSLAASAATIDESLIPQVADMAIAINDIPESKRTEVEAAIATGDPEIIETTLNNLSRTRKAAIQADVDTASKNNAEAALNNLARNRTAKVITDVVKRGGFADGTPSAPSGPAWVGEEGPELMNFTGGESVTPAPRSAEILRRGNGATYVTNVTHNWPAGYDSTRQAQAERRYRRLNGPT